MVTTLFLAAATHPALYMGEGRSADCSVTFETEGTVLAVLMVGRRRSMAGVEVHDGAA